MKRLPIAQLGVRFKGKQKIEITRAMLAEVVANFRKRDTGEVPIDYDHAIETSAGNGEAVPAAGWIKSIDDAPDGQGILWGSVQWTEKSARMIRAGEYKYVSPVIDPSARDNKTGEPQGWTLTSAALTNQPVLQGMPALVLSEDGRVCGAAMEEKQVGTGISADVELMYADQTGDGGRFEPELPCRNDHGVFGGSRFVAALEGMRFINMETSLNNTGVETARILVASPKVSSLIAAIVRQRGQQEVILAELDAAEADVRATDEELAVLRDRIAGRERDLATSGGPIPETPFPEDLRLLQAERQRRVQVLRVDIPREQLKKSQAAIEELKREVDAAWLEFGKEEHTKALLRFKEAALVLRERCNDILVLRENFQALRIVCPETVAEDVSSTRPFIHTGDPVWRATNHIEGLELNGALRALAAEIKRVKAGR
jgi:hypothetical protein